MKVKIQKFKSHESNKRYQFIEKDRNIQESKQPRKQLEIRYKKKK